MLGEEDGLAGWREEEAAALRQEVQGALARLQHPAQCGQARKLVCHLSYDLAGYGLLIHHTVYCLLTALATGRVLVLSDQPWYYSHIVIKTLLSPISTTCTEYTGIYTWYYYKANSPGTIVTHQYLYVVNSPGTIVTFLSRHSYHISNFKFLNLFQNKTFNIL